jgi:hypothetical protein
MWEEPQFTDGLWILGDGLPVYIDAAGKDHPDRVPFTVLAKLIQRLTAIHTVEEPVSPEQVDIERIRSWIANNAPPSSGPDAALRKWYASLAVESMRAGMTLLWDGVITTSLPDSDSVAHLLQQALKVEKRLRWPQDALVEIVSLDQEEGKEMSSLFFGQLTEVAG